MSRKAEINRKTNETKIHIMIDLDGTGEAEVNTGIGFFDHMLTLFARHGFFDLTVQVKGDLNVDCHHTVEDTGIALGEAIRDAVGNKKGIRRYGHCVLPMDEVLSLCAIDLSGRPYYCSDAVFTTDRIGSFDTEMIREFFYAVSYSAGMNLHFCMLRSGNNHHMAEAMFKSFAKSLDEAVSYDQRIEDVLSTKGTL